MMKKLGIFILFLFFVSYIINTPTHAEQGQTILEASVCKGGFAIVETPFDLNFGSFSAADVFNGVNARTGVVSSGGATAYTSNSPVNAVPDYYLVVVDQCANANWHADLLSSKMYDQNVSNNITATDIPAANVKVRNQYGVLYFLGTTPVTSQVESDIVNPETSLNNAVQMMHRVSNGDWVGGTYGIKPAFRLHIPQYQQPDTYLGTITWTII